MLEFGLALPRIRRRVAHDLRPTAGGASRASVLGTLVACSTRRWCVWATTNARATTALSGSPPCAADTLKLPRVSSTEVNSRLREASGAALTAKDFRTWHGSVLALSLRRRAPGMSALEAVRAVATSLRNTVAVCRKSYVHPQVLGPAQSDFTGLVPKRRRGLSADECALIDLIGGAA